MELCDAGASQIRFDSIGALQLRDSYGQYKFAAVATFARSGLQNGTDRDTTARTEGML